MTSSSPASSLPESSSTDSSCSLDTRELLVKIGQRHGQLVHAHVIPGREGVSASWPTWVHPSVRAGWQALGVTKPWQHQVHALEAVHAGQDVVIATGTGSGKSLAAWSALLSEVAQAGESSRISDVHQRPTAIYLSPTKALAADQLASLLRLFEGLDFPVHATTADGDTPREAKEWARAYADIILTNPDFLHFVLLPSHERWVRLLSSLRYIIIDELHHWRGVTGSHISLVIRRLLRIAHRLGADPQVIMLSATVRDPAAVGEIMIGRCPVSAVVDDFSPQGERHLLLWRPREIVDESAVSIDSFLGALNGEIEVLEAPTRRLSATSESSLLLSEIVSAGGRALAFVRSRAGAEALAAQVREHLASVAHPFATRVGAYRGGYLPEERRALEAALRSGAIRALATTSALELGIDVSGLDVTVTAGWPGTRASFWQQVGRAGRGGAQGVSVLVASDDPLDSYIVSHPEHIVAPVEVATIDPSNPWVLSAHVAAAAAEFPVVSDDEAYFGHSMSGVLSSLVKDGFLRERRAGERVEWRWDFTRDERACDLTDLRGGGGDVQIIDAASGVVIGSVPDADADAQVFPEAIYVHQGKTYHVLSLSALAPGSDQRVAEVEQVATRLRTRAKAHTSVRIVEIEDSWRSEDGMLECFRGRVDVRSRVTDFDVLRLPGLEFLRNKELVMPERTLETQAVWYTISPVLLKRLGVRPADVPGALHASEHASIGILPLLASCDRWDLGGLSCPDHEQTLLPTVFVYDAYRGGAGHALCAFENMQRWLSMTRDAVVNCECESGCPSCVQSPKCGNGNEPLSKSGAASVLSYLSEALPHSN